VTLKKRSADRVLAANNGIRKGESEDAGFELERKFEEDIKLTDDGRMRSLFSHTIDWKDPPPDVDLARLEDVEEVFPGFCEAVSLEGVVLAPIGGIVVTEHVLELAEAELAGEPIGVGLSVWYKDAADPPCVAEFSYKYEADEKDFDPAVAAAAMQVLTALGRMHDWRPPGDKLTKTRWFYAEAGLVD
jgi:hypothetical protein